MNENIMLTKCRFSFYEMMKYETSFELLNEAERHLLKYGLSDTAQEQRT